MTVKELHAWMLRDGNAKSFRDGTVRTPSIPTPDFILGVTKAIGSHIGLIEPTTSIVSAPDTTITTPNQTISNVRYDGNVRVAANNVKFYNCHFRGKVVNTGNNIVRANDPGISGTIFERCLFENRWFPDDVAENGAHGGVQGHDMIIIRCEFKDATDGVGIVAPGNVMILGSRMYDLWYFSPSNNHNDGTHCDGIQGHAGVISNVLIEGCVVEGLLDHTLPNSQAGIAPTFEGAKVVSGHAWYHTFPSWQGVYPAVPWGTSAILFGGTALNNVKIRNNWLDGGGLAQINFKNTITDLNSTGIEITGNRVGNNTRDKVSGRSALLICASSLNAQLTLSGNINEDDSTPNNSRRNG